ncbi:MAG: SMP-30/gluconolactonase/LRE family protein [Bacteroidota bacterium]
MSKLFITALVLFSGWLYRTPSNPMATPAVSLEKLWETDTTLTTPESVLYDPSSQALYVTCINRKLDSTNNTSFIAKLSVDGKVLQAQWATGLNVTKGMGIFGKKLYVTELHRIAIINLATGKVEKRIEVPGSKFLNDITVDKKGVVYFSDSGDNKVYSLQKDKVTLLSDDSHLAGPNGLLAEGDQLWIGNNRNGTLLLLNLKTKNLKQIADGLGATDGIVSDGQGSYFISSWSGQVFHVKADGTKTELINSVEAKINTADIEYIPAKKLLLVPTFFHNNVMAYQVK